MSTKGIACVLVMWIVMCIPPAVLLAYGSPHGVNANDIALAWIFVPVVSLIGTLFTVLFIIDFASDRL